MSCSPFVLSLSVTLASLISFGLAIGGLIAPQLLITIQLGQSESVTLGYGVRGISCVSTSGPITGSCDFSQVTAYNTLSCDAGSVSPEICAVLNSAIATTVAQAAASMAMFIIGLIAAFFTAAGAAAASLRACGASLPALCVRPAASGTWLLFSIVSFLGFAIGDGLGASAAYVLTGAQYTFPTTGGAGVVLGAFAAIFAAIGVSGGGVGAGTGEHFASNAPIAASSRAAYIAGSSPIAVSC